MNKVKRRSWRPVGLYVIDLECEIWRHPFGLDWTQIVGVDFCVFVLVCGFDGPYSSACTDVQDATWVVYWCKMKLAIDAQSEDAVE